MGTYYSGPICKPVIPQSQHSIKDICNQAFLTTTLARDLKASKLGAARAPNLPGKHGDTYLMRQGCLWRGVDGGGVPSKWNSL